ncbi:uncharacterized protein PV09_07114 [Verruconis gallopava]|uniref:Complex 1 LYR protein domain-containing protein n=1 Tax=Verruconis gallopava TaxID=253628 RepID=A0A0D1YKE7_9PEZI|nr:uncharacterized protein PV09_07114 [Verruconis gallopava]KIW01342.1 hypothetical protein PV09_07114 [Verruconis gallopava]
MARLSGVQRDVLSLYRKCLRAANKKPAETRMNFINFTKEEFRKNRNLDRKDFGTIEFLIRKGHRQLAIYEDPGIKNIRR